MNFSEYFYENWFDKVVTVVGVLVGIVTAVGIVLSKITECIKLFRENTQKVVEKSDELKITNEKQSELNCELESIRTRLEETLNETQKVNDNNELLRKSFDNELEKIKKTLFIAFVNSAELVKKGRAEQIAELLENENESKCE